MQYLVTAICLLVLATLAPTKENRVPNQPLSIHAKCRGSEKCIFSGKDMFIDISIANHGLSPVGFPSALLQMTGPSIRLIDRRTHAEISLPTNPGDLDLVGDLTSIPGGQSLDLEWVIDPSEIEHFAKPEIDISAKITVACEISVDGKMEDFQATDTLHITGHAHH